MLVNIPVPWILWVYEALWHSTYQLHHSFVSRPENHRPPKVWWRKNPLREKLQSGWTRWFIRILDCKSARKSVCFIGFLRWGGGQSSLRFPYKILIVAQLPPPLAHPPLKNPTSLLCALVLEIDFEMDTDTQMFHETCTFQVSRMYCTNVIRLYGLEISLWCLSFGVKLKLLNICSFMQWTWTEESAGSWKAHHECWKQGATPVSL